MWLPLHVPLFFSQIVLPFLSQSFRLRSRNRRHQSLPTQAAIEHRELLVRLWNIKCNPRRCVLHIRAGSLCVFCILKQEVRAWGYLLGSGRVLASPYQICNRSYYYLLVHCCFYIRNHILHNVSCFMLYLFLYHFIVWFFSMAFLYVVHRKLHGLVQ